MKKFTKVSLFVFGVLFAASNAFAANNPILIVTGSGTGNGIVTSNDGFINCTITAGVATNVCSHTYGVNNPGVILTATSNGGSTFSAWAGTGSCTGTGTCTPNGLNGNQTKTAIATFNIILDTTAPVITLSGSTPVAVELGGSYSDAGATASDNIDGNITANIVTVSTVNTALVGTYTITYNVHDAANNNATQVTRTVNVVDTTAPTKPSIVSPANNIIGKTADLTSIDWTDSTDLSTVTYVYSVSASNSTNGDGTFVSPIATIPVSVSQIATGGTPEGVYYYSVKAVDAQGNSSDWTTPRKLTVDNTAPIITLLGITPFTLEGGTAYVDAGATATDNVDASVTVNTSGFVNNVLIGGYVLTYSATDIAGNVATEVTRTVNVFDTTKPVITLIGDAEITLQAGDSYVESGADVTDNVDVALSAVIAGTVDTHTLGDQTVTYNVTDTAGNAATEVTRTIHIIDTTAPVITLTGSDIALHTGDTFTDPGYDITDNYDEDVEVDLGGDEVDTDHPGVYVITYNATDGEGNHATEKTRTVTVVDITVPIITVLGDGTVEVEVDTTYTDAGATAEDDADGDITEAIVTVSDVNTAVVGTYHVTYNVSDSSSNAAVEMTRTINVVDNTAPTITVTGDNPTNLKVGDTYTEAGATANDNYDGDITANIITTGSVNTGLAGTYTITYTVEDAGGNEFSTTRSVVVRNLGVDASLESLTTSEGVLSPEFNTEVYAYTVLLPFDATESPIVAGVATDEFATVEVTQASDITSASVEARTATVHVTSENTGEGKVEKFYTVVFNRAEAPDTTAPVITLNGDATITIAKNNEYTEEGATVTDDFDNDLTVEIEGFVDVGTVGVYTITYNAVDTAGNHAIEVTRTVNIVARGGNTTSGSRVGGGVTSSGSVLGAETFIFNIDLRLGMANNDVLELQKRLRAEGFFTFPTDTGYFGPITLEAVKKYQAAHPEIGFVTGFVGPLTRAVLNK